MTIRVGINGFGSIGRRLYRILLERPEFEVVAVNDITQPAILAHLLKYDSTYGTLDADVAATDDALEVDGKKLKVLSERDPGDLPWADLGADIVAECTGLFRKREQAEKHITSGGAKKVVISAPSKGEDLTMVMGVNQDKYDPATHHILSNASCTTNCLAPVAKVLNDEFGIVRGLMTTIHAYTNDQRLLDLPHKDLRRARAAAENMIPTTTGAALAVSLVLPELKGKLNGFAVRIPVPTVSMLDLVCDLETDVSDETINQAARRAAAGDLKGILSYSDQPLVSSDYIGNPHSAVVDTLSTMVVGDRQAKVVAWYDNEWAYCVRMADMMAYIASQGL